MESLQTYFAETGNQDIDTLGRYIEQYVNENWERVAREMHDEMVAKYDEIGDTVYGMYGATLFKPIHDELKTVGWVAKPRLPGNFGISREWGPETERQRWMWSRVVATDGTDIGTIVVAFFHDHEQIRIPRAHPIIALTETTKGYVVRALSAISEEFKNALEARVEYAAYYQ